MPERQLQVDMYKQLFLITVITWASSLISQESFSGLNGIVSDFIARLQGEPVIGGQSLNLPIRLPQSSTLTGLQQARLRQEQQLNESSKQQQAKERERQQKVATSTSSSSNGSSLREVHKSRPEQTATESQEERQKKQKQQHEQRKEQLFRTLVHIRVIQYAYKLVDYPLNMPRQYRGRSEYELRNEHQRLVSTMRELKSDFSDEELSAIDEAANREAEVELATTSYY